MTSMRPMPQKPPELPQAAPRRPAPSDPQGSIGRSLADRFGRPADAPLPERLASLLAALDLRTGGRGGP